MPEMIFDKTFSEIGRSSGQHLDSLRRQLGVGSASLRVMQFAFYPNDTCAWTPNSVLIMMLLGYFAAFKKLVTALGLLEPSDRSLDSIAPGVGLAIVFLET